MFRYLQQPLIVFISESNLCWSVYDICVMMMVPCSPWSWWSVE